jgi:methane monooxygenase component A beta chain/propane monooxygenase small subunit
MIILTTERDRRRNQAWTEELVRMTTAPDLPAAENNRIVIRSWIERWTPLANAAAKAFAPVYDRVPFRSRSIDEDLAVACGTQAKILDDLGIGRNGNG